MINRQKFESILINILIYRWSRTNLIYIFFTFLHLNLTWRKIYLSFGEPFIRAIKHKVPIIFKILKNLKLKVEQYFFRIFPPVLSISVNVNKL